MAGARTATYKSGTNGKFERAATGNVIRVSGHLLVDAEPIARGRIVADYWINAGFQASEMMMMIVMVMIL